MIFLVMGLIATLLIGRMQLVHSQNYFWDEATLKLVHSQNYFWDEATLKLVHSQNYFWDQATLKHHGFKLGGMLFLFVGLDATNASCNSYCTVDSKDYYWEDAIFKHQGFSSHSHSAHRQDATCTQLGLSLGGCKLFLQGTIQQLKVKPCNRGCAKLSKTN